MTPPRRLTAGDVASARAIVSAHLRPTPLRRSFALRPHDAWLKLECWQPTGSFKVRGALHNVATLTAEERGRGIVAASAGNHALGVAFAAQAIGGVRATVFVPETAPRISGTSFENLSASMRSNPRRWRSRITACGSNFTFASAAIDAMA